MKRIILAALLASTSAQAQTLPDGVTAATVYEVAAPPTIPGSIAMPWGAEAFSMNGHARVVYAMPPCVAPSKWTLLPNPVPPGAYDVLVMVDAIGVGNTLYVQSTGLWLGDPAVTQYFVCE